MGPAGIGVLVSGLLAQAAADVDKPVVLHWPCAHYEAGSGTEVLAKVEDASELFDPKVYYRYGDTPWEPAPLIHDGEVWTATVPISERTPAPPLFYFVEVFDVNGNGPTQVGTSDDPIRLTPSADPPACDQLNPPPQGKTVQVITAQAPTEPVVSAAPSEPAASGSAVRLQLRLDGGAGILMGKPQTDYLEPLGWGGNLMVGIGPGRHSILSWLMAEVWGGYSRFAGKRELADGTAYAIGGGLRLSPLNGEVDYLVSPTFAVHGGFTRTGELSRFVLSGAASLDFNLGAFMLGPSVHYMQLFDQPDPTKKDGDALVLVAGLSLGVSDFGRALRGAEDSTVSAAPAVVEPEPVSDGDGDGLRDDRDRCPKEAEDRDGFEDHDGCPEPDNDRDKVNDLDDSCPYIPEDHDGFLDVDGCPDRDNDGDGIPDVSDKCVDAAETYNGVEDQDGCPDADQSRAFVNTQRRAIEIKDKVFFKFKSDKIEAKSYPLLDDVANILVAYPQIKKLRVEGHTDDVGGIPYNQKLSERRATAVMNFLLKRGVAAERLEAVGYGKTKPLAPATSAKGRDVNRRVEFMIIEQDENWSVGSAGPATPKTP